MMKLPSLTTVINGKNKTLYMPVSINVVTIICMHNIMTLYAVM